MGEKKRMAKGCSSASNPSNLTSFIFHLVTEWNASSTSVAFYSARLAASPNECTAQGQRPPRKSGQPNSLTASSCPMTEVRNEGSLSGDKLISLVLLPFSHALFQLTGFVDMQLRPERLGQAWVTKSSSHFAPRVSQSSRWRQLQMWYYKNTFSNEGKICIYIFVFLSKNHSCKE